MSEKRPPPPPPPPQEAIPLSGLPTPTAEAAAGIPPGPPAPDETIATGPPSEEGTPEPSPFEYLASLATAALVTAQQTQADVRRLTKAFGISGPEEASKTPLDPLEPLGDHASEHQKRAARILGEAARYSFGNGNQVSAAGIYGHLNKCGLDVTAATAFETLSALARLGIVKDVEVQVLQARRPDIQTGRLRSADGSSALPLKLSDIAYDPSGMGPLWDMPIDNHGQRAQELSEQAINVDHILRSRHDLIADKIRKVISQTMPDSRFMHHYEHLVVPQRERLKENEENALKWAEYVTQRYIPSDPRQAKTLSDILHQIMTDTAGGRPKGFENVDIVTALETVQYLARKSVVTDQPISLKPKGRQRAQRFQRSQHIQASLTSIPSKLTARDFYAWRGQRGRNNPWPIAGVSYDPTEARAVAAIMKTPVYRLASDPELADALSAEPQHYSRNSPTVRAEKTARENNEKATNEYLTYMTYFAEAERLRRRWRHIGAIVNYELVTDPYPGYYNTSHRS